MFAPTRVAAAATIVAAALAACGSAGAHSGAPAAAPAATTPLDALHAAAQKSATGSARLDVGGHLTLDTSHLTNLPADVASQLGGGKGFDIRLQGSGERESASRGSFTLHLTPTLSHAATIVAYDGTLYTSADGSRYAATKLPTKKPESGAKHSGTGSGLLTGLIKDMGSTTMHGQAVEHYSLPIDGATLSMLLSRAATSAHPNHSGKFDPAAIGSLFVQFLTFKQGAVDAYVRQSDGRFDSLSVNLDVVVDASKIAGALKSFSGLGGLGALGAKPGAAPAQLPGGTAELSVQLNAVASDYDAAIHVSRPTADPNAPPLRLPSFPGLGSRSHADGGGSSGFPFTPLFGE